MCRWMGSHFHEWGCNFMGTHIFLDLGYQKIEVGRELKMKTDFDFIKFNQCVNSFQDDRVKRIFKVDA